MAVEAETKCSENVKDTPVRRETKSALIRVYQRMKILHDIFHKATRFTFLIVIVRVSYTMWYCCLW